MKLHRLLQKCSFFFRFDWTLAASGDAYIELLPQTDCFLFAGPSLVNENINLNSAFSASSAVINNTDNPSLS
jgi:hypothetical protein